MASTQDALYRELDLDLSWSEADLPERERTKHVHRLHPYLGKFIPQLVEALLNRYFAPGQHVLDPFAGSGTTLVQALESGLDATGADIASFNCLLMEVKTRGYNPFVLERELRAACERIGETSSERPCGYVRDWFAPQAARELLGLDDCRELEVGAGAAGTSRAALEAYSDGIVATFRNVRSSLREDAPVVIVVNDRRELYPEILERAGLREERRHRRHVNRRTGRRAGEYFEDVLVCSFRYSGTKA